jgi:hypothetical protein
MLHTMFASFVKSGPRLMSCEDNARQTSYDRLVLILRENYLQPQNEK